MHLFSSAFMTLTFLIRLNGCHKIETEKSDFIGDGLRDALDPWHILP
jgi:hypothetical protein